MMMARAAIAFSSKQHVRRRKTRDDDGQGAITSSSKQHVRRRKTNEDDGGAGLPFQANSTCVAVKPAKMMGERDCLFKQTARASP
jgi:hypothetical protein